MWFESSGGGGGTPITPSDTSPVALVNGETYEVGGNGYAIETNPNVHQITPTADGVAFTSGIKKMLAAGFACSQQPTKTKTGSFSGVSTTYKLTLGFKPKQICLYRQGVAWMMSYDENYSITQFYKSTSSNSAIVNLGATSTSNYNIQTIDDDGITIIFANSTYANYSWNYYAIG